MVSFSTESNEGPSQKDESKGDYTLNDFLNHAVKNLQNNQDAQVVLAGALEDSGIDPRFLSVFSDDLATILRQAQEQKARQEAENEGGNEVKRQQTKTEAQKQTEINQMTDESPEMKDEVAQAESITPDDLLGFISDLKAILPKGGNTTLDDLEELAEKNPDIVQNAIDSRF